MRGVNIARIKYLVRNFRDFKLPRGVFSVDVDGKTLILNSSLLHKKYFLISAEIQRNFT